MEINEDIQNPWKTHGNIISLQINKHKSYSNEGPDNPTCCYRPLSGELG